jgi:hypothetical protein
MSLSLSVSMSSCDTITLSTYEILDTFFSWEALVKIYGRVDMLIKIEKIILLILHLKSFALI